MDAETDECLFLNSVFGFLNSGFIARTLVSLLLIYLGKELTMGICKCKKRLDGKVVIITGANSGVGFETALDLVKRGAKVYLACRSKSRGVTASQEIVTRSGCDASQVKVLELDLGFLKSVRKFVEDFLASEKQLDILINNAGMVSGSLAGHKGSTRQLTRDKLETVMQTNYFGHFLLTNLLKEALKKSDDPRVVNVSSMYNMKGVIDVDNLNGEVKFDAELTYAHSKLANIVFTKEVAKRWASDGIKSYSVHPGYVRTNIFNGASDLMKRLYPVTTILLGKDAWQGAQTSIHCCLSDNLVNGAFYLDCRQSTWFCNRAADDEELGSKLWNKTSALLRI